MTPSDYPLLFSEFTLGEVKLRNRLVWLPHLTGFGNQLGQSTERHAYYYAERAKGGVGLIVTGCQTAHPSAAWPGRINAYDRASVPGLKRTSEMVHAYGAVVFGQITDDGNQNHGTATLDWAYPNAPSVIADPLVHHLPKAMEASDIADALEHYGTSAEIHVEAGFDGVEIKCAHDGIWRQFLSPRFNHRTDHYGGTAENRLRFLRETVDEIRRRISSEFVVGVRLCLDEGLSDGYGFAEGLEYARQIGTWGTVDYISSDFGSTGNLPLMNPPMEYPQGFMLDRIAEVRDATSIPVIAAGRIKLPDTAEAVIRDGKAELVGMARQLMTDPEWPNKVRTGDVGRIRYCIACNQGCVGRLWANRPITCILNPAAGREKEWGIGTLDRTELPMLVLIVGGGPGGMKAAEIAALRGHRVILFDRGSVLGGAVNAFVGVPSRQEFHDSTAHLEAVLDELEVRVKLGYDVLGPGTDTGEGSVALIAQHVGGGEPETFVGDAVIVATGSRPRRSEVPGADLAHVFHVECALAADASAFGRRALVWDAQLDEGPLAVAEHMAGIGVEVVYVTGAAHPGGKLPLSNIPAALARLYGSGAEVIPYSTVAAIDGDGVTVANALDPVRQRRVPVDSVVCAVGRDADESLYLALREQLPRVWRVGDCVAPRDVGMAIYSAERLARKLDEFVSAGCTAFQLTNSKGAP